MQKTSSSSCLDVITCVDHSFAPYAKVLKRIFSSLKNFRLWVYDIDLSEEKLDVADFKLVTTINFAQFDAHKHIIASHKPHCIKHFMQTKHCSCLYIDADCVPTMDFDPAVFAGADIAVTPRALREQKEAILRNGLINSGVLYFNNTPEVLAFFDEWAQGCADGQVSDQKALSDILGKEVDFFAENKDQVYQGLHIRLLDANIYNDVTCRTGFLFHCKSVARRRSKYRFYCVLTFLMCHFPSLCSALVAFNRKHGIFVYKKKKNEQYKTTL